MVNLTFQSLKNNAVTPAGLKEMFKATSTGHADSPVTLVIGRKRVKTPAALPKKGRKSMGKSKVLG